MTRLQLILGIVASLIGVLLFLISGKLAAVAITDAYQSGVKTLDAQIMQVVVGTEKTCQPADLGTAIILSKKCTEKPAKTLKK